MRTFTQYSLTQRKKQEWLITPAVPVTHHTSTHDTPIEAEHEIKEEFQEARRSFLRNTLAVGGGSITAGALGIAMTPNAFAQNAKAGSGKASHYYIPASANTVHWGIFQPFSGASGRSGVR